MLGFELDLYLLRARALRRRRETKERCKHMKVEDVREFEVLINTLVVCAQDECRAVDAIQCAESESLAESDNTKALRLYAAQAKDNLAGAKNALVDFMANHCKNPEQALTSTLMAIAEDANRAREGK